MSEPLRMDFEVACSVEHAFTVWTEGISTWWPADHTTTGRDDLQIVLQHGIGGRIFERTPDGEEFEWGEVTVWQPPRQLAYLWHLRADRAEATEVQIRFVALDDTSTRVEIEHHGWQRLGETGDQTRERNRAGWQSLLPHFQTAIGKGGR